MEAIWLIILAGILGGGARSVLGFLGEAEPGESFSYKKAFKSILRAVIGGAILAYSLTLDPKGTFFAAFAVDFASKSVWDILQANKVSEVVVPKPVAPS